MAALKCILYEEVLYSHTLIVCGVSGDDADLCSELLQESLDALRALPEATLFDEGTVSPVWLEVVERATKFLRFASHSSIQLFPNAEIVISIPV